MKINLTTVLIVILLLSALPLFAVKALPRAVSVEQADGSVITIMLHGDERFHYTTTSDGYLIAQKEGVYYHATMQSDGLRISEIKANDPVKRSAEEADYLFFKSKGVPEYVRDQALQYTRQSNLFARIGLNTGFPTSGKIRSLVILVNFSDKSFESATAEDDFHNLLNQEGYSENGATGSARDYYVQNSMSSFIPTFDVVGPLTLSKPCSYYGQNNKYGIDANPEEMVAEACKLASESGLVNFADYDYNNDGLVDNVFVYYAGTNEAEGGGENTIWPHRSELIEDLFIDGKKVLVYACSSEKNLAGDYPAMAGIGTFCHEFGHVLGWPDFYDTDGSINGDSEGVWDWSIMCSGSYNNQGRTPPAASATERMIVGWIEPEKLEYTGNYTLEDLQSSNKAYLVETDKSGEYFILENRQNDEGWDKYLDGHGLLIFHVDRSDRYINGSSALERWDFNTPNAVSSHQCYRIITARPNSVDGYQSYMPFPGASNNREFSEKSNPENRSWSGSHIPAELLNITEENRIISFRAITPLEEIFHVESVEITGKESIILNDTARFKAVIFPKEAKNHNVTWESSDERILTVDEKGIVRAVGCGTGKIKVTTEEGGFTDEMNVKVTDDRQLFRARTLNSALFPVAQVKITLSDDKKSYESVSDQKGLILIENIPEGEYTLTISHAEYPEQRKGINILKGASLCDIVMLTKEEMEHGTGNFNIIVREYETSAYASWPGSKAERWRVEWHEKGNDKDYNTIVTDRPKIDINDLKKKTEYIIRVSEMSDVIEGEFCQTEFTTTEPTSEFPVILLHALYEKGETLLLKAANIPDGSKISWKVDDTAVESVEWKTTRPEHKIELTIECDGKTEIITKYINVIE